MQSHARGMPPPEGKRPEGKRPEGKGPVPGSKGPVPESKRPESKGPVPESKGPVPESKRPQGKGPVPESKRPEGKGPVPESNGPEGKGPVPESKRPEGKGPVPESKGLEVVDEDGPYYRYPGGALLPVYRMPQDCLFFSLISFSYANCCCLGLAALVFSIKSRDSKVIGDAEGAEENGKIAKCLNVVAFTLAFVFFIVAIIVLALNMSFILRRFLDAVSETQEDGSL